MADWTFRQALSAIKNPPSIPTSVLESSVGLYLGDIHFVELHTTLRMRVSVTHAPGEVNSQWFIQPKSIWQRVTTAIWLPYSCHSCSWCQAEGYRESGNWAGCLPVQWAAGTNISVEEFISDICDMRWSWREHLTCWQLGCMSCSLAIMVDIWLLLLTRHSAWLIHLEYFMDKKDPVHHDLPESWQPLSHLYG